MTTKKSSKPAVDGLCPGWRKYDQPVAEEPRDAKDQRLAGRDHEELRRLMNKYGPDRLKAVMALMHPHPPGDDPYGDADLASYIEEKRKEFEIDFAAKGLRKRGALNAALGLAYEMETGIETAPPLKEIARLKKLYKRGLALHHAFIASAQKLRGK